MKQVVLSTLALAGLTTVLAGCGTASTTAASAPAKKQSITLITWVNPPAVAALKQIDQEFHKKYPNITVNYQTAADDLGGYVTMQETAVRNHEVQIMGILPFQPLPYHVNINSLSTVQLWATHRQFVALNGQPWLSRFNPTAEKSVSYHGKV
jgi:ABC-type glycerol-3-phosphate transport system substrate-binding protein